MKYVHAKRNNYRKAHGELNDRFRLERTDRCLEEVLACCIITYKIKKVNSPSSISDYMKLNKDLGMQALNLLQSIKARLDDKLLLPLKFIQHPDVLERIEVENEEIEWDTVAYEVAFGLLGGVTARGNSRIKKSLENSAALNLKGQKLLDQTKRSQVSSVFRRHFHTSNGQ
jgi:hypothetical protein